MDLWIEDINDTLFNLSYVRSIYFRRHRIDSSHEVRYEYAIKFIRDYHENIEIEFHSYDEARRAYDIIKERMREQLIDFKDYSDIYAGEPGDETDDSESADTHTG